MIEFDADIHQPAVFDDSKLCRKCKKVLPLSLFQKETGTIGLLKTQCKSCLSANAKASRQAKKLMGQPPMAGYQCPLCDKVLLATSRTIARDFVADHDNKTGKPRDWICRECNTSTGKADHDPLILVRQAAYLIEHESDYERQCFEQILKVLMAAYRKSNQNAHQPGITDPVWLTWA